MKKRINRKYQIIRIIDGQSGDEEVTTQAWEDILYNAQYGQAEVLNSVCEEIRKRPAFEAYLNDWRIKKTIAGTMIKRSR